MFVVIARYRTAAENAAAVRELLVPLAAASRTEPGNRGYEVLESAADPCSFAIVEHYADREAFDAHLASAHFADLAVVRIRPLLLERTVDTFAEIPGSTA